MMRTLLVAVVLAVTAVGCGDSDDDKKAATPAVVSTQDYVTQLNALCQDLTTAIWQLPEGREVPTIAEFVRDKRAVDSLFAAFDAKVDAIQVADADQEAADAFDAFRDSSDARGAKLDAAAATGDPATFRAAWADFEQASADTTAGHRLFEVGIKCSDR